MICAPGRAYNDKKFHKTLIVRISSSFLGVAGGTGRGSGSGDVAVVSHTWLCPTPLGLDVPQGRENSPVITR